MTGGFVGEVTIVLPRDGGLALQNVARAVRRAHPSIAILETEGAIHVVSDHHSAQSLAALWMSAAANQAALMPASRSSDITFDLHPESEVGSVPDDDRIDDGCRKQSG